MVDTRGGYWGTAVADHGRERLVLTMKYYVFGQFTRYIRPGCRLIAVSGDAVAAEDPQRHRLVVVAMNAEDRETTLRVDLSALGGAVPAGAQVRAVRTRGTMYNGEHWAEIPGPYTKKDGFTAVLAPYSVTTFLIPESPRE